MNGIHDMGGMHGFGSIDIEENEPVFHDPWEGRMYAISTTVDIPVELGFRYTIECMEPTEYLRSTYYEKWLHSRLSELITAGVITQEEYDATVAQIQANLDQDLPRVENPELAAKVVERHSRHRPLQRETTHSPTFNIGDLVRTRNVHPIGHTRLPRYARGKECIIVAYYGFQDIDDTMPPGVEAQPEPVYAVRFQAQELWGESAEPNATVCLDMWESYLEPRTC